MIWRFAPPNDDRSITRRFLDRRDEASFRTLYRRHTPRLLQLARRLSTGGPPIYEEIVQEVWVRAVRALPGFEWKSTLATWLGGITINVAREMQRDGLRQLPHALPEANPRGGGIADPLISMTLNDALEALPNGYRSVLVLHDVGGFTHDEIATVLGIEAGTSKSQLARARRRIRDALGGDFTWEDDG